MSHVTRCVPLQASHVTGDRLWRMPLYQQYLKQIESHVADIHNTGTRRCVFGGGGGSVWEHVVKLLMLAFHVGLVY